MSKSLYTFCVEQNRPELLAEFNYEKNGELSPDNIAYASHKKVWWRCSHGHEWQAQVGSRTRGAGCPYCANRRVRVGENDLATTHPELAKEWHPTKNGTLTPQAVTLGSTKRVWWRCEKGHEWQALVYSRVAGRGCPVCGGKVIIPGENDLASAFPKIAAQWHPTRNGKLTPETVTAYSNRRVWWVCEEGHEYQAVISRRTEGGVGCPYCAGRRVLPGFNDLATLEPGLAAQWHPELNGSLTPQMVTVGSHKKVWWQCAEGHVWRAVVYSRTGARRCGCPVCAGKVKESQLVRYTDIAAAV